MVLYFLWVVYLEISLAKSVSKGEVSVAVYIGRLFYSIVSLWHSEISGQKKRVAN